MFNFQKAFDRLDQYINQRMETSGTPGMTLALFNREKCVRVSTYGVSELETQTPVKSNTLFEIGSITKSFVAVAVVRAAECGLLDLYAPVTDYLPWFQVQSEFAPITVHHLLTHSAGIIGIIDRSPGTRGAVWAVRETETAWPPGTHFHYSDTGYQALGLVLEEVMKQPFAAVIWANIFDVLGMTSSEPTLTHAMRPRMAKGYRSLYDDRPYHSSHPLVPAPWIETNAGDCCIASTAEDITKYGRMLLNRGQGPNGKLLSDASFSLLIHQPLATEYGFSYGCGLEVHQGENLMHIGHGGGMPGYEAFILMDVDNGLGVTLLSTQPSIEIRNLAWTVIDLWRKSYLGQSLDSVDLSLADPAYVEKAADFAGTYHSHHKTLTLSVEDKQLLLHHQSDQVALQKRGTDCFYVNHPDFDRFLLRFGRTETIDDSPGDVVEAFWGADWYVNDSYTGAEEFKYPSEWNAYPGHYRSHIPWQTNFRLILRKGAVWLIWPTEGEEPLTSIGKDVFRIGNETSPERLRFSKIVNGQALCANYSGSDYYRFFTP
ncbi:MAG: beta-lactamase family protein [Chloroflexi bacterium]|nr:beta-lactamase family protein [Chloroflexota bacterium]